MPTVILWYVRTALLYIVAAAALGVWYQLEQWLPATLGVHPYLIVIHTHLALVGGVIQMIMAVGLWMFPLTAPLEERLSFRPGLAWAIYALFNGGLLGRFVVEWLYRSGHGGIYGGLTVLTGLMQLAALLVFVYHLWALRTSRRSQAQRDARKGAGNPADR